MRHGVTNMAASLPLVSPGASLRNGSHSGAATIALPMLPAVRQGAAAEGGALPLPAVASVRQGATNAVQPSSLTMPPWMADAQMTDAWRASELERQARTQKEREEQFQQFRRAFYRFLSVNAGE